MFSLLLGESWKESILCIANSDDGGRHWSHPSLLLPKKGFMGKTHPITLASGKILIPIYHEAEICPYLMLMDDLDSLFEHHLVAETMARGKAIQPVIVELEPDRLLMFCRTNQGMIWKSLSYNGGLSWGIFTPTQLPNPDSAIDLIKTQTGALILAFNNSSHDRHALSLALSEDQGTSWRFMRTIEHGEGEYSYPCLFQGSDEHIHLVYTDNRYRITHATFDLEWVKQERLATPLLTD
jgi:predicted neuraminidase